MITDCSIVTEENSSLLYAFELACALVASCGLASLANISRAIDIKLAQGGYVMELGECNYIVYNFRMPLIMHFDYKYQCNLITNSIYIIIHSFIKCTP